MSPKSDSTTEEKIKTAARNLFTENGYAATKTRDIAEAAGINLALLNYYFRSKEKLFEIVMQENLIQFFSVVGSVVNNESLSFNEKIEQLVKKYTEMLISHPDLPYFIIHEVRNQTEKFEKMLGLKKLLQSSHFVTQLKAVAPKEINPLHFLINILSLTVFPFVGGPLIRLANNINEKDYTQLLQERIKLIPFWIDTLIQAEYTIISKSLPSK